MMAALVHRTMIYINRNSRRQKKSKPLRIQLVTNLVSLHILVSGIFSTTFCLMLFNFFLKISFLSCITYLKLSSF